MTFADSLKSLSVPEEVKKQRAKEQAINDLIVNVKKCVMSRARSAAENNKNSISGYICVFNNKRLQAWLHPDDWCLIENWEDNRETALISEENDKYSRTPYVLRVDRIEYKDKGVINPGFRFWKPHDTGSYRFRNKSAEYLDLDDTDLEQLRSGIKQELSWLGFTEYTIMFDKKQLYYYGERKNTLFGLATYCSRYDAGIGKALYISIKLFND